MNINDSNTSDLNNSEDVNRNNSLNEALKRDEDIKGKGS